MPDKPDETNKLLRNIESDTGRIADVETELGNIGGQLTDIHNLLAEIHSAVVRSQD
jgi:hypothetical protein